MASSPSPFDFARPGVDIVARLRQRLVLTSHVMHQRAAAALARRNHDLDAVAIEQANGGFIGRRRKHRVDAAGQQRYAAAALAFAG
jgi:hypothetical protein